MFIIYAFDSLSSCFKTVLSLGVMDDRLFTYGAAAIICSLNITHCRNIEASLLVEMSNDQGDEISGKKNRKRLKRLYQQIRDQVRTGNIS